MYPGTRQYRQAGHGRHQDLGLKAPRTRRACRERVKARIAHRERRRGGGEWVLKRMFVHGAPSLDEDKQRKLSSITIKEGVDSYP